MQILPGTLLPNYLMLIVIENRVEKYHPTLLLFVSQNKFDSKWTAWRARLNAY